MDEQESTQSSETTENHSILEDFKYNPNQQGELHQHQPGVGPTPLPNQTMTDQDKNIAELYKFWKNMEGITMENNQQNQAQQNNQQQGCSFTDVITSKPSMYILGGITGVVATKVISGLTGGKATPEDVENVARIVGSFFRK